MQAKKGSICYKKKEVVNSLECHRKVQQNMGKEISVGLGSIKWPSKMGVYGVNGGWRTAIENTEELIRGEDMTHTALERSAVKQGNRNLGQYLEEVRVTWWSDSCHPVDCSPPGFSVHRIFQARIWKWVAISFSRGSFWPRDWSWVSTTAGNFFTDWATREAHGWYTNVIQWIQWRVKSWRE